LVREGAEKASVSPSVDQITWIGRTSIDGVNRT
jgi:hypothetical protein